MQALGLMLAVLAVSGGDAELKVRHATERQAARRVQQQQVAAARRNYIPAPRVVNTVYGPIPGTTTSDGQAVGAYADPANNTIYLQKDPSSYARAHETAHLLDSQVLSDGDRRYFQRLMQAPSGPWNHGETYGHVDGLKSPNEWFADYYAGAATGQTPANGYSVGQFAEIGSKRMKRFEKAMARLAKRHSLKPYK